MHRDDGFIDPEPAAFTMVIDGMPADPAVTEQRGSDEVRGFSQLFSEGMAMFWKSLAAAAAAVLGLLAWTGTSRADDLTRLDGRGDAGVTTLELKDGAETILV